MRKIILCLSLLAVVSLLAGCSQQSAEEKFLGHYEKIVGLLNDNKTDPAKASAAVKEYVTAHIAEMKDLAGQFGKPAGLNIRKDPSFILRFNKLNAAVLELKKYPVLLNDPALTEASAPLAELFVN